MEIVVIAVNVVLIAAVIMYNRLIRAKVRVRQAWAHVAVQLQRRHDLIPNLVGAVQGYAAHERQVLDDVTRTRATALQASSAERADAEDAFEASLGRLLLLAENYPDLKADANFRALQQQLTETDDRIAFARDFASSRVAHYRKLTTTWPGNLLAGLFRFPREEMFALDDPRAAAAPDTKIGRRITRT